MSVANTFENECYWQSIDWIMTVVCVQERNSKKSFILRKVYGMLSCEYAQAIFWV